MSNLNNTDIRALKIELIKQIKINGLTFKQSSLLINMAVKYNSINVYFVNCDDDNDDYDEIKLTDDEFINKLKKYIDDKRESFLTMEWGDGMQYLTIGDPEYKVYDQVQEFLNIIKTKYKEPVLSLELYDNKDILI